MPTTTCEPETATRRIPYRDAAGKERWVEVSAAAATALDLYDRWARRRAAKFRANHVVATDVAAKRERRPEKEQYTTARVQLVGFLSFELEPAAKASGPHDDGFAWEGPRAVFTHLLGESWIWNGPAWLTMPVTGTDGKTHQVCRFCGLIREPLPTTTACLGCPRTGKDATTPKGQPRTVRKKLPVADGLQGGLGKTG